MKGTIHIRDVVFFYFINFLGAFHSKRSSYASQYIQIYLFSWQLPIIFIKKQIKYHVFNAVTNSELTEIVPVFTIWPAFPTSVKKVSTSFKNVWRTWGPALPTWLADLVIFCPLGPIGPMNLKTLKRTTDHGQETGKLYYLRLRVEYTLFVIYKARLTPTPYW